MTAVSFNTSFPQAVDILAHRPIPGLRKQRYLFARLEALVRTIETEAGWKHSGPRMMARGLLAFPLYAILMVVSFVNPLWVRWRNKPEARAELARLVADLGAQSYETLRALVTHERRLEFTTAAGTWYQAVIEVMWDDMPGDAVRVMVSLDDGGRSAYHPMTESFVISPTKAL